jgi:hypothetical protein
MATIGMALAAWGSADCVLTVLGLHNANDLRSALLCLSFLLLVVTIGWRWLAPDALYVASRRAWAAALSLGLFAGLPPLDPALLPLAPRHHRECQEAHHQNDSGGTPVGREPAADMAGPPLWPRRIPFGHRCCGPLGTRR